MISFIFSLMCKPPPSDFCSMRVNQCSGCVSGFLSCGLAPEKHMNWFPNPLRFQEAQNSLDRIMTWQCGGYCSVITAPNRHWL